jgi:hypothetical protein
MKVAALLALAPLASHAFGIIVPPDECERETSAGWHPDFPPEDLDGIVSGGTGVASSGVAKWFKDHLAAIPMRDPPTMTARAKALVKMSAGEWFAARKAGTYTCVEYAAALTARATHYKYMNQFMCRAASPRAAIRGRLFEIRKRPRAREAASLR